jgi:hypothetical protein
MLAVSVRACKFGGRRTRGSHPRQSLTRVFSSRDLPLAAGHRDWRVPTREELLSIVNYRATSSPAAFAAFHGASCGALCTDITDPACSCTALFCWSASGFAAFQGEAWEVDFNVGSISVVEKSGFPPQSMFVRAVRGGAPA